MNIDELLEPITKEWLRPALEKGEVIINFIKTDGTEREMRCTLNRSYIPDNLIVENIEKKEDIKANDNVLRVYDLDKAAWRSFRLDRITMVRFNTK